MEEENNASSKLPGIDGDEGSETKNDLNKDEIPKVSHSIERDLDSYEATEVDLKLAAVFDGEYIRNNDGSHLDGGIKNDDVWQQRYKDIIIYPLQQYDLPNNVPIGKTFVLKLADEINGELAKKWNMERVICFISMVLQISLDIKGTSNVKRRSR